MIPLSPCEVCARHVRVSDVRCPFCGEARRAAARSSLPETPRGASRAWLTALGANIVNMSFVGSACGYWIYAAARTATSGKTLVAAAAAAWCSVVLASAACAVELALSGTVPLRTALPAMVAVHALIGVGEAAITCLVVASVLKVRPDLVPGKAGCA